jgi:hypothetical protein
MIVGGDLISAWDSHQVIFSMLKDAGVDLGESRSEFERVYEKVEKGFVWADANQFQRWMKLIRARHWLKPSVIVGRDAAMRVLGRRALTGQTSERVGLNYDALYPIYDPQLDLIQPVERPGELRAMEGEMFGKKKESWLKGVDGGEWAHYPNLVEGLSIIGERTWFIRPEWEWPREERYRGLMRGSVNPSYGHQILESRYELTYDLYLGGYAQRTQQLIVLNSERQLVGPMYRWAAINSNFARALGWAPSETVAFEWVDSAGNLEPHSIR